MTDKRQFKFKLDPDLLRAMEEELMVDERAMHLDLLEILFRTVGVMRKTGATSEQIASILRFGSDRIEWGKRPGAKGKRKRKRKGKRR
jgi:hypothetical protein